jgi:hypothetical protein
VKLALDALPFAHRCHFVSESGRLGIDLRDPRTRSSELSGKGLTGRPPPEILHCVG